ncbi:hypothetical protein B7494_g2482 [Chlorociboria aeruginascens]|nr:hypothetical protein B7494_g2482 [Chlorociboria aeruginascens]
MTATSDRPFRVIVVGGGITGLTASHTLSKAGIDHIVVESGSEAAPPSGASIAIYPHGARILEQIDCLEASKAINIPCDRFVHRMPNGKVIFSTKLWEEVKENHGYEIMLVERRKFLQVLYDCLPDKSKIRFGKKVRSITETYDGVEVFFADGTSEKGDIVIGCDGVHSKVREMMWENAGKVSPGFITTAEKKSECTTWTCLLGMGPPEPELPLELSGVHNDKTSFLIASRPDVTFYFTFFKVPKPYSQYTRPRWTEEDANKAAASVADRPISESLVFGDLWKKRFRGQIVDLEEGILEHWHFGRMVLVGDSAHKITPNIALGGNSGIESISVLTNLLRALIAPHPNVRPSRAALNDVFQKYQEIRIPRMHQISQYSNLITRVQAWDGYLMKFIALYVLPYQPADKVSKDMAKIMKAAPKLDFIPIRYGPKKIRWDDEDSPSPTAKNNGGGKGPQGLTLSFLGVVIALVSVIVMNYGAIEVEIVIFAGAMVGFCLARLEDFDYSGRFAANISPGYMYFYRSGHYKVGMIMHLTGCLPAGILMVLQFVPTIRHNFLIFHRINGYLVLILLILCNVGAMMILGHGSPGERVDIGTGEALLCLMTTVGIIMAYGNIKRLQVDQHRAWMLRTMFYYGAIVSTHVLVLLSAMCISRLGKYYTVWTCDEIDYLYNSFGISGILESKYPQCLVANGTLDNYVVVKAIFNKTIPESFGASLEMPFGIALWLSIFMHGVGVEIYLNLTPKESQRLRQVSYEKQLEAGYKNPGFGGWTVDRFGDAEPWKPRTK